MKEDMGQSKINKATPMTSVSSGKGKQVRSDVYYYTNKIVNIVMLGMPMQNNWVLVDTGLPGATSEILSVVRDRFGGQNRPAAIVLTHGHFDHVGNIVGLIKEWNVPVFAHPDEFPYLSGEKSYPEPDTSVEGGLLAKISSIFPNEPVNIKQALNPLPLDGSIPFLNGWKWLHTPGHSPGHVSLFRESDRTLLPGDAFITVRQDSFYKVLMQKSEVNGPPRYFTTDWQAAWDSVRKLESLLPDLVVSGHGQIMQGQDLADGLRKLVQDFDKIAIPEHGKYVNKNLRSTISFSPLPLLKEKLLQNSFSRKRGL